MDGFQLPQGYTATMTRCRQNDYTTEINVLLQVQFYNTFANVVSIMFKSFH